MALKQYFYIVLVPLKLIPKRTASFWQTIKIPNRFVLKICTGGFADYNYPEIFGNEEKIIRFDKAYYPMPERLLFLLTHRDVWLDFFKDARRQESIGNLKSGMPLRLMEGGCCDSSDKEVVRFSNSFKKEIEKWLDKGYELKEARVNFVVYWKKTGEEEEVKVLLPEIVLVKVRNLNVSELMIL